MNANAIESKLLCKEFLRRSNEVLQSGVISDCSFLVGQESDQELFSANKTILAVTSPVFEAMFFGSLAERKHPIPLLDICPKNFKILLGYIYTDEVTITSIEQASELYYSAKKFLLSQLQQRCSVYLIEKLDYSNACCIYEYGQLFEDEAVMNKATDIMSRDTNQVLNDASFLETKLSTLIHLFSLDILSVETEIDLLEAAVRYKEAQTRDTTKNDLGDKAELSIQEVIEKIRFLTVSPKAFADCKVKASLLSESEILAILLNLVSHDTEIPYPKYLCNNPSPRCCTKFSFTHEFHNIDFFDGERHASQGYKSNNFIWTIVVEVSDDGYGLFLGIFLSCCPSPMKSKNWSCQAKCLLKLNSIYSPKTKVLNETFEFKNGRNKLGKWNFVPVNYMLDPGLGYTKDNVLTVEAYLLDIKVDQIKQ